MTDGTTYLGTNTALAKIQALQQAPWYPLANFADILHLISSFNFSVQAQRTQVIQMLAGLPTDAPYAVGLDNDDDSSANIRFPPGVQYVCSWIPPYVSYLQQVQSACSFKERANEKTMLGNQQAPNSAQNAATPSPMVIISNYNDASQAFQNALTGITNAIANLDGVFDQGTFENEFNVFWGTPTFFDHKGRHGNPVRTLRVFNDYVPVVHKSKVYAYEVKSRTRPLPAIVYAPFDDDQDEEAEIAKLLEKIDALRTSNKSKSDTRYTQFNQTDGKADKS